jgi:hypothetical protein
MTWTLFTSQQQRGTQMPPKEAVADRAAQDHEQAGGVQPQPGEAPASPIEQGGGDNTPAAGTPRPKWDEIVQPQPQGEMSDEQPPEGK